MYHATDREQPSYQLPNLLLSDKVAHMLCHWYAGKIGRPGGGGRRILHISRNQSFHGSLPDPRVGSGVRSGGLKKIADRVGSGHYVFNLTGRITLSFYIFFYRYDGIPWQFRWHITTCHGVPWQLPWHLSWHAMGTNGIRHGTYHGMPWELMAFAMALTGMPWELPWYGMACHGSTINQAKWH